MNRITVFGHNLDRLLDGVLVVELNAQCAFGQLSVMVDSDILDTHIVHGEQRGNGGDGTGFICNIYRDNILLLDGSAGGVDERLPIISRCIKKVIQRISGSVVEAVGYFGEILNIKFQKLRDIIRICQADLLPHSRRR